MRKYEIESLPYYKYVPKGAREQARFRRMMLVEASGSEVVRRELWQMCARDPLFFINTFCHTYDPRLIQEHQSPVVPFNTYPFQDNVVLELLNAIGRTDGRDIHDRGIRKCRDMGATWMVLTVFLWLSMFREHLAFGLVSSKEDRVDKANDPDCLFWKLDFLVEPANMPNWLAPVVDRSHLVFRLPNTRSTINGEATIADAGRAGRRTALFVDEIASIREARELDAATSSTTPCRIFVSTPKGRKTHFADMEERGKIPFILLLFPLHPLKSKGLYYDRLGKPRSPSYDIESARIANPVLRAQELDGETTSSDYVFYPPDMVADAQAKYAHEPTWIGNVFFDDDTKELTEFTEDPHGLLRMWIIPSRARVRLDADRRYAMGADVSMGTGATNSVLTVIDKKDQVVVAEYASAEDSPERFADIATALGRHFAGNDPNKEAFICWETNGGGKVFGNRLVRDNGYGNFYYREGTDERQRPTRNPGWVSSRPAKLQLLSDHRLAMETGELRDPSVHVYKECGLYIYGPDGSIVNGKAITMDDPSGARDNNADRVISRACAWLATRYIPMPEAAVKDKVPRNSFAWRKRERDRKQAERAYHREIGPNMLEGGWSDRPRIEEGHGLLV